MKANKYKEQLLSAEQVRAMFDYNPDTGIMTRKTGPKKGCELGSSASGERLYTWINGEVYSLSRVIWLHYYGVWPENLVDHEDQNKKNNSIDNLREATYAQNCQNKKAATFKGGIKFSAQAIKRPWQARITFNGKRISLGWFETKTEASAAYNEACIKYHGEFAQLGVR